MKNKKRIFSFVLASIILSYASMPFPSYSTNISDSQRAYYNVDNKATVNIPDPDIKGAIYSRLKKPLTETITAAEINSIKGEMFIWFSKESVDLNGVQHLINVDSLFIQPLTDNTDQKHTISGYSYLSNLTNLKSLALYAVKDVDLNVISDMIFLEKLSIDESNISNADPLSKLYNLRSLSLAYNQISNLNFTRSMLSLLELNVENNRILNDSAVSTDISPSFYNAQNQKVDLVPTYVNEKDDIDFTFPILKPQLPDVMKHFYEFNEFNSSHTSNVGITIPNKYIKGSPEGPYHNVIQDLFYNSGEFNALGLGGVIRSEVIVLKDGQVVKEDLIKLIAKAKAIDLSNYTHTSGQILTDAIAEAEKIRDQSDVKQQSINTISLKLISGINSLEYVSSDKKHLLQIISFANNIDRSQYITSTIEALDKALENANKFLTGTQEHVTQKLINEISKPLFDSIAKLEKKASADKSSLKSSIDIATYLNANDYTQPSWDVLQEALVSAQQVYNDAGATQLQVDNATFRLSNAMSCLVKKASKVELKEQIDLANSLNRNDYTEDSLKRLDIVLAEATNVYNDTEAKQAQVDAVVNSLKSAISSLEHKQQVNKTELKAQIDIANSLNRDEYTADSLKRVDIILREVTKVYNDAGATQLQVDNATFRLSNAMSCLVKKASKVELKEQIDLANSLNRNDYTEDSLKRLDIVLAEATNVYNDTEAKQAQVDAVVNSLKSAISSLEHKQQVNKTELKAQIDIANSLNRDEYIPISLKHLDTVLEEVTRIYNDANAKQSEVDNATNKLRSTIYSLEKKPYKLELKKQIDIANSLNRDSFIPEALNRLDAILKEAINIYNDVNSTQSEVSNIANKLNATIVGLEVRAYKIELEKQLYIAHSLNRNEYTVNSLKILDAVLEETAKIYNDINATQLEVDNAVNKLRVTITTLNKSSSKVELKFQIDIANRLNRGEYTPNSLNKLDTVLKEVEKVYNDANATPEQIDSAIITLKTAMSNLNKLAYKGALKRQIDYANSLDRDRYTAGSLELMDSVLEQTMKVYNDANASQLEVDYAMGRLRSIIVNLQRK